VYKEQIEEYYAKDNICEIIAEVAANREVVPIYTDGSFGKRPSIVNYAKDVEELIKEGAVSFHGSVERWYNPMLLRTDMKKSEYDELRKGWDLVIDIDAKSLEYAKVAAKLFVSLLKSYDISSFTVKFSGRRGWHIAIPYEAFPQEINGKPTKLEFPRLPRIIISYMKKIVENELRKRIERIKGVQISDPYRYVEVDTNVISVRHLFRLPYSLHTSTWLVSLPISYKKIEGFEIDEARPEVVKVKEKFLVVEATPEEATELVRNAVFWYEEYRERKREVETAERDVEMKIKEKPRKAVDPKYFPPCIKKIMEGLDDGRKRAVFVLTTFLYYMGWSLEKIEKFLYEEWNKRNREPLRESVIRASLRHQKRRLEKKLDVQLPPNCDHENYYKGMGVCEPDNICEGIRNPLTYALKRMKLEKNYKTRK